MDEWTKLTRDRVFISDIGNDRSPRSAGRKHWWAAMRYGLRLPEENITGLSKSAVTVRR